MKDNEYVPDDKKIAYQCSRCAMLYDNDNYVGCAAGIDARPRHREKGTANLCKRSFKPLDENKIWHKRFRWERL